jgi:DNA-binding XRE family transcriptional regulator
MRLSHSAREKYEMCPRKYKHHYIDKLRSPKIASPLFFGSALDDAFSHLLCTKKEELTETELTLQLTKTAEQVFEEKMLVIQHNRETVELAKSPFADYYTSDFTEELLKPQHLGLLQEFEPAYSLVNFLDFHKQCKEQLAARKKLQLDDQKLYNYLTWLTLVEKGKLMVDSYRQTILPQVDKVYDIQKSISLKNQDGDEITGLIDFTASFVDSPGVKYICDNKTSSKPYSADSVKESAQLATYCEAEEVKNAAYVVIEKKVFKKAPNIRSSVIKDQVSEETLQKTFDLFENTVYSIEKGSFDQNWDSCFAFGRMCEYYAICKHGSYDHVVKLEDK